MNKLFLALLFWFSTLSVYGQSDTRHRYSNIDTLIHDLYSVISGEKAEVRDWDLFRTLFYKNAYLMPLNDTNTDSLFVKHLSVEDYVRLGQNYFNNSGFIEKEIHRVTDCYGNICHLFSTYASYHSAHDEKPFVRGINSIQLMFDNDRWWVVNIYWQNESEDHPIPPDYLPD